MQRSNISQYWTKTLDIIIIEVLEPEKYYSKPKYQVKFNKYILGIFKSKSKSIRFARSWIKKQKLDH